MAHAQLKEAVKDIFSTIKDSVETVYTPKPDSDSIQLDQMKRLLQEAKINEMNLRIEMEQIRLASSSMDSLKKVQQKSRIDSLRTITQGVPVIINKDTLFTLYAKRGGLSPYERAQNIEKIIDQLGRKYNLKPDSVYIETTDHVTDIMYGSKVIISLTDVDGLWQNTTRTELAQEYKGIITQKLHQLKEEHGFFQLLKRILYFILVLVIQYLLYKVTTYLYRKLKTKIISLKDTNLHYS